MEMKVCLHSVVDMWWVLCVGLEDIDRAGLLVEMRRASLLCSIWVWDPKSCS